MAAQRDDDATVLDQIAVLRAERFVLKPFDAINLIWALEFLGEFLPGWRFEIANADEMRSDRGGPGYFGEREAKGAYLPWAKQIRLSDEVYEALCDGDPWAREVAAHELGHALLGHPTTSFDFGDRLHRLYRPDELGVEREAALAADELLFPRRASGMVFSEGAELRFGVTQGLAERQRARAARG